MPLVSSRTVSVCALLLGLGFSAPAQAEDTNEGPPAPYDLAAMDCGELDKEAGLRPMRAAHIAGDDLDVMCRVTVSLSDKTKGTPKAHSVKFTVSAGGKVTYEQVRDARVLSPGSRVVIFVVPAEKLPTEAGKVTLRAELSKPVNKPGQKDITFDLTAED